MFQSDILDLLVYFGYRRNKAGRYTYQSPRSDYESQHRQKGVKEFQRLCMDLKDAQNDDLDGFKEFIRVKLFIKTHDVFLLPFVFF